MKRFGFILFALSLLPLVNLLTPGIMDAHDAPDHVARIANFYASLQEGILMPRWAANLNWGYGHPILMFLYPLPSYIASFFHVLGAGFVDSVKLVFAASYVLSLLAFFLWTGTAWGPFAGFVGAVVYGFAPYRFVDLYVRGAIGEHVAFIFPPIIFLGLLRLARGHTKWSWITISLGVAGLLLSHNAVSLMVFPLIMAYAGYLSVFESKNPVRFLAGTVMSVGLGMALSAFFWLPAFFEGKYTLRDIVTKGDFAGRFVNFSQFIFSPWNYGGTNVLSKEVGIAGWIAVLAAPIWTKGGKRERAILWGTIFLFFASLLIQTVWTQGVWNTVTILQKFQFPWRFLTVSVILSSTLASLLIGSVRNKSRIIGSIILVTAVVSTFQMWRAKSYTVRPETHYTGIYDSTTDTGESSPIWSVRFMEHRAARPMEAVEGKAIVTSTKRATTVHEYLVDAKSDSRLAENTLYFPGWRVFVDGVDVQVEFQDPQYRGLMTFTVPQGEHAVRVVFGDTKLRRAATFISLLGLFAAILVGTIRLWVNPKHRH